MNYQEAITFMEETGCSFTIDRWSKVSQERLQIYLNHNGNLVIQEEEYEPRKLTLTNKYKQDSWVIYEGSYDRYIDVILKRVIAQELEQQQDENTLRELEEDIGELFDKMIQLKLLRKKLSNRVTTEDLINKLPPEVSDKLREDILDEVREYGLWK